MSALLLRRNCTSIKYESLLLLICDSCWKVVLPPNLYPTVWPGQVLAARRLQKEKGVEGWYKEFRSRGLQELCNNHRGATGLYLFIDSCTECIGLLPLCDLCQHYWQMVQLQEENESFPKTISMVKDVMRKHRSDLRSIFWNAKHLRQSNEVLAVCLEYFVVLDSCTT